MPIHIPSKHAYPHDAWRHEPKRLFGGRPMHWPITKMHACLECEPHIRQLYAGRDIVDRRRRVICGSALEKFFSKAKNAACLIHANNNLQLFASSQPIARLARLSAPALHKANAASARFGHAACRLAMHREPEPGRQQPLDHLRIGTCVAERRKDIAPNIDYFLRAFGAEHGQMGRFNKAARDRYMRFVLSPQARWTGTSTICRRR